jgi:transposase
VPADHPLRAIRVYADEALRRMSRVFNAMYADGGRQSVPPETLLKSMLLMALYSVRSERLLCEMLEYNLLFRWFLGLGIDEAAFDHSIFSKNRQRLLEHRVAPRFLGMIAYIARRKGLVSDEHFSVDGTLINVWASMKSVIPKDRGAGGDAVWAAAIPRSTSRASAEPTTPMPARPIPRSNWRARARARARKVGWPTRATP